MIRPAPLRRAGVVLVAFAAGALAAGDASASSEPSTPSAAHIPAAGADQVTDAAATSGPVVRLTLLEAVDRAQQNSPRLMELRAIEEAAAAGARGARAEGRPEMHLTAGYFRSSNVPEFTAPEPGGGTQVIFPNIPDNYYSRLGFSVPLYTGGRVSHGEEAAEHERTAASHDVESGTGDTALEARTAYWDLVAARESERVLRESVASYEAHLKQTRDREQLGLAARNDVLAVQVNRDRAELDRMRAANAAEVANADLVRILGLDSGARVEPEDVLESPDIPPSDIDDLVARAIDARPERAALVQRIAAAEARARALKAGTRPQVSVQGGYDYSNPNRRILPMTATWQDTWDVGVSLSFPFLDSGRTSAGVEEASAQAAAARAALQDLDRRIRLEVTARHLDLGTAAAGVQVAERNIEAATENVRVSEDRYKEGVIPSSELLDAETALLHAGLDRVEALVQVRLALARLQRAVGS
jgi:outer membrane protein